MEKPSPILLPIVMAFLVIFSIPFQLLDIVRSSSEYQLEGRLNPIIGSITHSMFYNINAF
jgi:hypothetical protein